jgi:hypothetical protein
MFSGLPVGIVQMPATATPESAADSRSRKCGALRRRRYGPPRVWLCLPLLLFAFTTFAAEVIPPKPERYFNDYAGVASLAVQQRLDRQLEDLEKTNSTQIIVVI